MHTYTLCNTQNIYNTQTASLEHTNPWYSVAFTYHEAAGDFGLDEDFLYSFYSVVHLTNVTYPE